MRLSTRRRQRARDSMESTKARIHKAIWSIIDDGKSGSLKVADIAKAAGIGKSTVYEYFKDKDHAVVSAITSYCENIIKKYDESDLLKLDFDGAFKGICSNMMEVADDYGENLMNVITRLGSMNIESVRMVVQNIQQRYMKNMLLIMDKGKAEGKIKPDVDMLDMRFASEFLTLAIGSYFRIPEYSQMYERDEYIARTKVAFLKLVN